MVSEGGPNTPVNFIREKIWIENEKESFLDR